MILRYDQRIFEACDLKDYRRFLHYVRFSMVDGKPVAEATNGRILARIDILLDSDETLTEEGVQLSAQDLREGWGRGKGDRYIEQAEGVWTVTTGKQTATVRAGKETFPDTSRLWPELDSTRLLTIKPKELIDMAKASGSETLTLEIPAFEHNKKSTLQQVQTPIRIRMKNTFSDDNVGIIMPTVIE